MSPAEALARARRRDIVGHLLIGAAAVGIVVFLWAAAAAWILLFRS